MLATWAGAPPGPRPVRRSASSCLDCSRLSKSRFASRPLYRRRLFTRALRVSNGIVLLFSAALFPMWYVSSLYLQQVLGLSPLDTGLTFLPMALMIMVSARLAGSLVGRFGIRSVLASGLVILASRLLLFVRIGSSGSPIGFVILPGLLITIGIGTSVVLRRSRRPRVPDRDRRVLPLGL